MNETMNIQDLICLTTMRRENPDKYKRLLVDIKDITKDMFKITKELADELE